MHKEVETTTGRKFKLFSSGPGNLYRIGYEGGGQVPDVLKGLWSYSEALKRIASYKEVKRPRKPNKPKQEKVEDAENREETNRVQ